MQIDATLILFTKHLKHKRNSQKYEFLIAKITYIVGGVLMETTTALHIGEIEYRVTESNKDEQKLVKTQRMMFEKYCRYNNFQVKEIYIDDG